MFGLRGSRTRDPEAPRVSFTDKGPQRGHWSLQVGSSGTVAPGWDCGPWGPHTTQQGDLGNGNNVQYRGQYVQHIRHIGLYMHSFCVREPTSHWMFRFSSWIWFRFGTTAGTNDQPISATDGNQGAVITTMATAVDKLDVAVEAVVRRLKTAFKRRILFVSTLSTLTKPVC